MWGNPPVHIIFPMVKCSTYQVNVIKSIQWEIVSTGGLSHLPGVSTAMAAKMSLTNWFAFHYSKSLTLSNASELFWSWISKNHIKVKKGKSSMKRKSLFTSKPWSDGYIQNYGGKALTVDSVFIWTMSYRVDSDIFTPCGNFIPLQCNEEQRDAKIETSKDAGKTQLIAWIVEWSVTRRVDAANMHENFPNICRYISSVSAGTLPAPVHRMKTFQQKRVLNDWENTNFC